MKNRSATKCKAYKLQFRTIMTSLLVTSLSILLVYGTSEAGNVNAVNGTIADGEIITIRGSGFGSSGPNVVVFDDFESGTVGEKIKTGGGSAKFGEWNSSGNSSSTYYSNGAKVSGTKSFTANMTDLNNTVVQLQAITPQNTRDLFVSWWLFLPSDNNWPGEGHKDGINWKQMWILGHDTANDDYYFPVRTGGTWLIAGNDPVSRGDARTYVTSMNMQKGEWKRMWGWIKGSTTATSKDGELKFWDLKDTGVTQYADKTGINTLKESGTFDRVNVNGYGRFVPNCFPSFDDVYIASGPNAQARVEIGNASVYSQSTKLTIITPTSWSDGSISAQVNTGRFNAGEQAFLFVFKSDGSISSGYPIKIGGSSTSLPSPPNKPDFRLSSKN